jgi:two-component system, cell cycle response regulator DivK
MNNSALSRTVLVVDDTHDVRELLRTQISMLGYRVVEATNGLEAVEVVSREAPALILMDLMMPILDGIEATRMIRQLAGNSKVIIVAFTALPCPETRQKALAAGCNDYIHKSLELEQLSSLLEKHLMAT